MAGEGVVSPLLAVGALLVVLASMIVALAVGSPGASRLRALVLSRGQWGQLGIAGVAMGASLYYSEAVGFVPCEFCWYQRIAMYPLAVVLAVAVVAREFVGKYVVALAGIGLLLSMYHYQLQLFPEQGSVCSSGVPCTAKYVDELGFVSVPFMAGCVFLGVLLLQVARWRSARVAG